MENEKALIQLLSEDSNEGGKLKALLERITSVEPKTQFVDVGKYIEDLRDLKSKFDTPNLFKANDIVRWKKDLKNRKIPEYGQPAIVVAVLDEPILADHDSGTPYFREPLDLVLGLLDDDGEFITFHYDKRRFELFQVESKKKKSQK